MTDLPAIHRVADVRLNHKTLMMPIPSRYIVTPGWYARVTMLDNILNDFVDELAQAQ